MLGLQQPTVLCRQVDVRDLPPQLAQLLRSEEGQPFPHRLIDEAAGEREDQLEESRRVDEVNSSHTQRERGRRQHRQERAEAVGDRGLGCAFHVDDEHHSARLRRGRPPQAALDHEMDRARRLLHAELAAALAMCARQHVDNLAPEPIVTPS